MNFVYLLSDNGLNSSVSSLVSTPLIKSMSQIHLDGVRRNTPKTLMDEYTNTFSSKKAPLDGRRSTISNITLDIIKQRVENINRNASFNRSIADIFDDPMTDANEKKDAKDNENHTEPIENGSKTDVEKPKPLKRKLFVPPSMSMDFDPDLIATPPKTDKKTATSKSVPRRKRNSSPTEELLRQDKPNGVKTATTKIKATKSRRSTIFFETPISKTKSISSATHSSSNGSIMPPKILVCTSMHQPQIDFTNEVSVCKQKSM